MSRTARPPAAALAPERPVEFRMLPVDQVDESPRNPRRSFDQATMQELTDSVRAHGVIEPILVRPVDGHFEVVAGARRLRACRAAERTEIPALVQEMTEAEALEIGIIENLQRADVHPMDEAEGFEQLLAQKERPCTVEELAAKVGKSKAYIYARLKLTALCPKARKAFFDGAFNASIALLVARIPDVALQKKALEEIEPRFKDSEPLSFREAARVIHERFMLKLSGAPFQTSDPELVPGAGACSSCPKRTGAQPELFDDVGDADVCTDPNCYQTKLDALWKRRAAEAKATGREVLEGKKAKDLFRDWGYGSRVKPELQHNSGFVDLDQSCYEDPKQRAYRRLLGKHAKEAVVLARDPSGGIHELVPQKEVKKLLKAAGHDFKAERASTTTRSSPVERAAAEKERKRRALEEAVDKRLKELVGQAFDTKVPDREIWDIAIDVVLDVMYGEADHLFERRFGADGEKAFEKARPDMTAEQLRGLFLDLHLSGEIGSFRPQSGRRILAWAGIDRKKVEAEVKAELAAAAEAGEVMKCAPPAAPKRGTCFICGCTEAAACPGGCAWVDETELICSAHPEDAIAFARKELAKPASGKKRGRAR
jgi:ParB/RepB/Spo0J family partition protein